MFTQDEPWFIFEITEVCDSKVPVIEGYFFVAAKDRRDAASAASRAARADRVAHCYGAHRLPAELVARHAGEWPGRVSEAVLADIERNFPGILQREDGERRLARPSEWPGFNQFAFAKAAIACLPLAVLAANLHRLMPDIASSIPARWSIFWLATLLAVTAFGVNLRIQTEDFRWPFWRIARFAVALFAAGLLALALF